ncbi:MAG: hypothetical protein A2Z95_08355 [Gallionellales bacterium GWA2_60_18]|nr:MAG: hypothetical protein A2Z95_08355 [Gallionellales bacterium GWA2_60_18]
MRSGLILFSILLSSCSYLNVPVLAPYKMDIRQGNYVTPEMREKLQTGMTKAQVRFVLGTPMINDAFHGNRWDYAYRLAQRGKLVEKQHLALYFEDDRLVRAEEDGKPAQFGETIEVVAPSVPVAAVEMPAQPEAQAEPSAEVQKRVQDWAVAWSARNVRDYLAAYAPDYCPAGMSREAWEKQRLDRISKPKSIGVVLSDIRVEIQDESHATASFKQDYRSDHYRDSVRKTLKLEKAGGAWLIVAEQVGK